MHKRFIINILFVISFPVYGLGSYLGAASSPSLGYLVSLSVYAVIILFYLIDLIYRKDFRIRLNSIYVLMLLFLLSAAGSLFVALENGLPETNFRLMLLRALLLVLPFHAFIIFILYNDGYPENLPRLTLLGLSVLLFFNLAGYFVLGLSNAIHSIEGRLSFPFIDGFYSGAGLLAIINLMLLYYFPFVRSNVILAGGLIAYFMVNLAMFYMINSRLAILIFLLLLLLWLFRMLRTRVLYFLSIFTIPILLSSGLILYEIFQWPTVASIVQRVDIEDVTTFHGRSYIWNDGIDWLLHDQRGLFFGNGYKGHYFLDLLYDVVKKWNAEVPYYLHLHSTSLEILVSQGVIAFVVFCYLAYKIFIFYMEQFAASAEQGAFFPVTLFLVFILQVDTFVYLDGIGFVILAIMLSNISVRKTGEVAMPDPVKPVRWEAPEHYTEEVVLELKTTMQKA